MNKKLMAPRKLNWVEVSELAGDFYSESSKLVLSMPGQKV